MFSTVDGEHTLIEYLGNATELVLPDNYNGENYAIGADAFKGNSSITGVTIPNGVTSIEDSAFSGCDNIDTIKVYLKKPISVSDDIFSETVYDNAILYVPKGSKWLYEKRIPWNKFSEIRGKGFLKRDRHL